MRRPERMVAAALTAVLTLGAAACGSPSRAEEVGALAAARAYVTAIAARDVHKADAMTDPRALVAPTGRDAPTDIRAALPDAVDPIRDTWVTPIGKPTEPPYVGGQPLSRSEPVYDFEVSYVVRGRTGGTTIALQLDDGGDPSRAADWSVVTPLIVQTPTFSDRSVPAGRIGPVVVHYADGGYTPVWGYPGGYVLRVAKPTAHPAQVVPLWVAVGADDAPRWNEDLRMLHRRGDA